LSVFFLPLPSSLYVDIYHCSCHNKTISETSRLFLADFQLQKNTLCHCLQKKSYFLLVLITASPLPVTTSFLPFLQPVSNSLHSNPSCQYYFVKPFFKLLYLPPQYLRAHKFRFLVPAFVSSHSSVQVYTLHFLS